MNRSRLGLLVLTCLGACTGDTADPEAQLRSLTDCNEAKTVLKQIAIQRVNTEVNRLIADYASGNSCAGWGRGEGLEDASTTGAGNGGGSGSGGSPPAPSQGTGTNNQVAGVDEADFVKNDGQYIYLAQNGVLRIVDAWPADQTHEVSVTPLEGTPKKLFVLGDTALVYVAIGAGSQGYYNRDCTYGYDCDFSGDGTSTKLLVFDLTDRTTPQLTREIALSGSLITARRIGSAVHTVVTQAANPFPRITGYPTVDLCAYRATSAKPPLYYRMLASKAFSDMRARNLAAIEKTELDTKLPSLTDSSGLTQTGQTASCSSLYASSIADGSAFTTIMSISLDHPGPVKASTIISRSGAIYASTDALYMAVPHQWSGDISTVHKFRIDDNPAHTRYLASGIVTGRALNQFAMDEQDGFLRIATTDGHLPSPDVSSFLTVLEQDGKYLRTVGEIGHIAPTEDIRSVRFDGDRAFIVTFKKTDPLFAFDLSNPRAPRQLGELKIPGFSTYMHMLDSNHLLTIGYDADDHGSFAYFSGVLLQIFDVTDPTQPALAHKHVIGTRGSSSEALTNHLAFTWYPEESLLALPMTICEGGGDGSYGQMMTFSGLMVFDATVDTGFAEHGRVAHTLDPNATCYNWWTRSSSTVKRSLFLDNFVYSISEGELKVRDVNALTSELVTLPLE